MLAREKRNQAGFNQFMRVKLGEVSQVEESGRTSVEVECGESRRKRSGEGEFLEGN